MIDVVFESNTVRVWLRHLAHDLAGNLRDAATVTYTVTRADGSTHTSGSMTYYVDQGWHASFTAPALGSGTTETLRVVVRAQALGATRDFRRSVTVRDIAAS